MSDFLITIHVNEDRQVYHPGDTVRGTVVFTNSEEWQVVHAEVLLCWKTEGLGEEDDGVGARGMLMEKGLLAPLYIERHFILRLPSLPWTYYGHHIKLHWFIAAYAKPSGAPEASQLLSIIVHPHPERLPALYEAPPGEEWVQPPE